mgnify:CR=1 FL=1
MQNQSSQHYANDNVFTKYFSQLNDPRRTSKGNYFYPLNEILFLTIAAVISGADNYTAIQAFGDSKLAWLRRFFSFTNGIPSHDVIGKIFSRINPKEFSECFSQWVNSISRLTAGEVVAIDGKTIKGSANSLENRSAFHVVSAYAAGNRVCLGQEAVGDKSNESTAIPELLETLAIKGCTITIDAMGCQKTIARKIIANKADYVLMVKNNQKELKTQIEKLFKRSERYSTDVHLDEGHGRVETRTCDVLEDLTFLDGKEDWDGLKTIIRIRSERYIKKTEETTTETRFYISSLSCDPKSFNQIIRSHWAIENNLHWSLDVIFNEDKTLKKKDNAALNFNIVNKIVLSILEKDNARKMSKKNKRMTAALDDKYREKLLIS